jgi:hypothetical protein
MSAEAKVYDLDQVAVIYGGVPLEGGTGEGGFITITPAAMDFEDVVGSDGSVTRSKTGNKKYDVTITVLPTSGINAILATFREVDLASSNGGGIVPMVVKDLSGLDIFVAEKAWIKGPPEKAYGKTAADREWPITAFASVNFTGGA